MWDICSSKYLWKIRFKRDFNVRIHDKPGGISWPQYYFDTERYKNLVKAPGLKPYNMTWKEYYIKQNTLKISLEYRSGGSVVGMIHIAPGITTASQLIKQIQDLIPEATGLFKKIRKYTDNSRKNNFALDICVVSEDMEYIDPGLTGQHQPCFFCRMLDRVYLAKGKFYAHPGFIETLVREGKKINFMTIDHSDVNVKGYQLYPVDMLDKPLLKLPI